MRTTSPYKANPYVWGAFFISLGALLLLERFSNVHIPSGSLWPLILFFVGVGQIARLRFGAATFYMGIALVFLACTLHLFGMSYEKSWPLLLVIVGSSMVARALTGGLRPRRVEEEIHHE